MKDVFFFVVDDNRKSNYTKKLYAIDTKDNNNKVTLISHGLFGSTEGYKGLALFYEKLCNKIYDAIVAMSKQIGMLKATLEFINADQNGSYQDCKLAKEFADQTRVSLEKNVQPLDTEFSDLCEAFTNVVKLILQRTVDSSKVGCPANKLSDALKNLTK
jgi:hypothetical protein